MKFPTALLTVGLALVATAEPIPKAFQKRAVPQCYLDALDPVADQLAMCKALADAWNGTPCPNQAILDALDDLTALIGAAETASQACAALNIVEGLDLAAYIQGLIDQTNAAVQAAIDKGPLCPAMDNDLCTDFNAQYAAVEDLAVVLANKAPPELADLAQELTNQILAEIQAGIDAFC